MNPFNNNKPNLSSSDRIRDKKSAYIYNATKKKFQMGKKTCGSKNIKLYKKGTVRSVSSYKMQQDLARGNVLCEDCDGKGMLCTTNVTRKNLEKTTIANNAVSEFWGGSTLTPWLNPWLQVNPSQAPGFTVIESDISGVWGGTTTDPSKSILGPDASKNGIPMPYGYIKNLIDIPRNLNGSKIEIDASGILFPSTDCGTFRYMKNVQEKIIVQVTTYLDLYYENNGTVYNVLITNCNILPHIPTIKIFKGTYVLCRAQLKGLSGAASVKTLFIGVIKNICCDCDIPSFNIELFYLNKEYGIPQFGTPYVNDNSDKVPLPWEVITLEFWGVRNTITNYVSATAARGDGATTIKAFKVIQGDPCYSYSLSYNNRTRQNYLYCLEDKTKNINFTKHNQYICPISSNISNKVYCLDPSDCTVTLDSGTDNSFWEDITVTSFGNTKTYRVHHIPYTGFASGYNFIVNQVPANFDMDIPLFEILLVGGGSGGGSSGNVNVGGAKPPGGGGGGGAGGNVASFNVSMNEIITVSVETAFPYTIQAKTGSGGAGGDINFPQPPYSDAGDSSILSSSWTSICTSPTLNGCNGYSENPSGPVNCYGDGGVTGCMLGNGAGGYYAGAGGISGVRITPSFILTGVSGEDAHSTDPNIYDINGKNAGNGRDGWTISITGTPVIYGGGGGGGGGDGGAAGTGGAGGGGDGGVYPGFSGTNGTANLGGGGGGSGGGGTPDGGNGGDGIIIIRYPLCT